MEPYILQDEELNELVFKIPGWEIKSKQIQREFNFANFIEAFAFMTKVCLLYTSPSPRDLSTSRMPSSA